MSGIQTIVAPSRVGPFVFRGTVGSGAFSVVKLAFNETLKEFFACKIVPRNRLNSDDLEARFEMEIRINQQMHHPGVVQIVDLLKDDLNFYIFMEFCPNGELFKYILDRGRLTEPEAAVLVSQILSALNYVHSLGVAHRDLKPENLLLDPAGRLKISDFGLSRFVASNGLVNTPCGSPCYASPECLSGHPYDGRRSDVWSVGVIMFAMVTGQLPWTKRNQAQLFNQIKRGEYTIPSFLTDDCRDILSRFLTVDVEKRIQLSDAMRHPWLACANQQSGESESVFTIVSLRKVDDFFETNILEDAEADESDIVKMEKNLSQRMLGFGSVVKAISKKLPMIKTRGHGYTITQSMNMQPRPPVSGARTGTASNASLGKIPNQATSASGQANRQGRMSVTTTGPKLVIPHRPITRASWVTLK